MDKSYALNKAAGYTSFAANHRALDNIPAYPARPNNVNANNVTRLALARNFLYIIGQNYASKATYLRTVKSTNYDVVLMDAFDPNGVAFSAAEIGQLKRKANGARRLVISYMSIGEAENYRYYWKKTWKVGNPTFISAQNPDWPGNYKVKYWIKSWQNIIFGNNSSYLKRILNAGFDGVYLDIIDAFSYFENPQG
ncbi:hypothetical protein AAVH_21623 [Aphelenchoides avenae]|nr:hypothetical protein AAVH_21623 [Aphelenchus avenae]